MLKTTSSVSKSCKGRPLKTKLLTNCNIWGNLEFESEHPWRIKNMNDLILGLLDTYKTNHRHKFDFWKIKLMIQKKQIVPHWLFPPPHSYKFLAFDCLSFILDCDSVMPVIETQQAVLSTAVI